MIDYVGLVEKYRTGYGDISNAIQYLEDELYDVEGRLSALLDEVTGGRLSKPSYDVTTMVQFINGYFHEMYGNEMRELEEEIEYLSDELESLRSDW